jgi:hypothetical protein
MPDSDPPGVVSHQVTLNTSSWTGGPGEVWMLMAVAGVVRVDPTGCVYLGSDQSDVVRDIVWPAGHTASREPDGSVTIRNRDGVVVAATGHRIEFGGGGAPPGTDFNCRAQGSTGAIMVTDVLPPLTTE